MDYLDVLKIFRPHYGKNQKYYSEIHPILYYNDEFFTNPFLKNDEKIKEEVSFKPINEKIKDYKLGFKRNNFFKLLLRILKERNFNLHIDEIINQMIYDFDTLNLYKEYNFRQYKISRMDLRNMIYKRDFNNKAFMQFCADYFSFQIFVLNSSKDIAFFYPRSDIKILAPQIFIYDDINNETYYHIKIENKLWFESNDKSYNKYLQKHIPKLENDIIDNNTNNNTNNSTNNSTNNTDTKNPKKEYDCNQLRKMKLVELQKMASELNIQVKKLNPRKTRMINKKKDELISDIIKTN